MGLVDLRDAENPEPYVGWADDEGQIVARARMRRTEHAFELISVAASDVEAAAAMVRAIAEVASAPSIVTSLSDPWLAEKCGFIDGVLELRPEVAEPAAVVAFTLAEVEAAITSSWCAETSPRLWTEDNPARGQCDVTALVVRQLFGGSIMCCNVVRGGVRVERHAWNVLESGLAIDLTRRQYDGVEVNFEPPVEQEPYEIGGLADRAALLLQRVLERLDHT